MTDPARKLATYEDLWLLLQTVADEARVALAPFEEVEW